MWEISHLYKSKFVEIKTQRTVWANGSYVHYVNGRAMIQWGFNSTSRFLLKQLIVFRLTRAPSVALTITSDIAIGAGLGSSAAFSVCIAASLLFYFGVIQCAPNTSEDVVGKFVPHLDQLVLINHWAFLIESIIHGRASGIDNSVSTYGGIIMYCDQEMTRIPSRLKLDVVVVDTMVQRDTKRMVELVQRRQKLVCEGFDGRTT